MTPLLDVNVLVAITQPDHVHHDAASRWAQQVQPTGWATTPLTELGLLRLSCNPKVTKPALTPSEAVELVLFLTSLPGHEFWPDLLRVGDESIDWTTVRTHREVTDARLVALACAHGGQVATFDAALVHRHGDAAVLVES